eukprot:g5980.t1
MESKQPHGDRPLSQLHELHAQLLSSDAMYGGTSPPASSSVVRPLTAHANPAAPRAYFVASFHFVTFMKQFAVHLFWPLSIPFVRLVDGPHACYRQRLIPRWNGWMMLLIDIRDVLFWVFTTLFVVAFVSHEFQGLRPAVRTAFLMNFMPTISSALLRFLVVATKHASMSPRDRRRYRSWIKGGESEAERHHILQWLHPPMHQVAHEILVATAAANVDHVDSPRLADTFDFSCRWDENDTRLKEWLEEEPEVMRYLNENCADEAERISTAGRVRGTTLIAALWLKATRKHPLGRWTGQSIANLGLITGVLSVAVYMPFFLTMHLLPGYHCECTPFPGPEAQQQVQQQASGKMCFNDVNIPNITAANVNANATQPYVFWDCYTTWMKAGFLLTPFIWAFNLGFVFAYLYAGAVDFSRRFYVLKGLDDLTGRTHRFSCHWREHGADSEAENFLTHRTEPPLISLARGDGKNIRSYVAARRIINYIGLAFRYRIQLYIVYISVMLVVFFVVTIMQQFELFPKGSGWRDGAVAHDEALAVTVATLYAVVFGVLVSATLSAMRMNYQTNVARGKILASQATVSLCHSRLIHRASAAGAAGAAGALKKRCKSPFELASELSAADHQAANAPAVYEYPSETPDEYQQRVRYIEECHVWADQALQLDQARFPVTIFGFPADKGLLRILSAVFVSALTFLGRQLFSVISQAATAESA